MLVGPIQTWLTESEFVVIVWPKEAEKENSKRKEININFHAKDLFFVLFSSEIFNPIIFPDSSLKIRFQFSEKNPCHALPLLIKA